MMRPLLLATCLVAGPLAGQDDYIYKIELVRAAPGRLLELIDLYQNRMSWFDAVREPRPAVIRHSQGDHWDLMLVHPIDDLATHFSAEQDARRAAASEARGARGELTDDAFAARRRELVAWREETFFSGPPLAATGPRFRDAGLFHIEMFVALPGKHDELVRQRQMENDYLRMIGRPENVVLNRRLGGAWDLMTIGFYRDLKHFAESVDVPPEREEVAARAAGFEGAGYIGSYLRSLISSHHDTLGVPVR